MITLKSNHVYEQLLKCQENHHCFECGSAGPTWASLPNAIFICMSCCGIHRGFGVHISFTRSIDIDSWTDKQIEMMKHGGNKRLKDYFTSMHINLKDDMIAKYKTRGAVYYRNTIKAEVEKQELPIPPNLQEANQLHPDFQPKTQYQKQNMANQSTMFQNTKQNQSSWKCQLV